MVTKLHKTASDSNASAKSSSGAAGNMGANVKDSAQQIWLAGLGAFAKAQEEGGKVFEALVREGTSIHRKTQAAAEEKITEATSRMSGMAADITSKATGQWDKLENIFEDRVAKALKKLGVPSSRDIDVLIARIDELNRSVSRLSGAKPAAKPAATAKKAPAKKAPAKKAAAKKSAR